MKLDVVFTPAGLAPAEVQGKVVFVIDVLRAGTTICAALHHGARAVVPVASTEEAMRLVQTLGPAETVLAGERNCLPIPGFALGNSPAEMQPEAVQGRTVIMTTTNGTAALLAVASASEVCIGGAVNFTLAAARARRAVVEGQEVLIICAGREQRFALDDAYTAGRLAEAALGGGRGRKGLSDGAIASLDLVRRYGRKWERPFLTSQGGRDLIGHGFRNDITLAAQMDSCPVLPLFSDRRIVAADPAPA